MDGVDLVVPVKRLAEAKTRLRGAADDGRGDPAAHAALALALARDTVRAARAADGVHRLIVVTSDPQVAAALTGAGVEVVDEGHAAGLNPAYRYGERVLRERDPDAAIGALQADLPALHPAELAAALAAALAAITSSGHRTDGGGRAFVADADGTGTTLLVAGPGVALDPRFGPDSAVGHSGSGAIALDGAWPGLRRDVDTAADLVDAERIGLGPHSAAVRRAAGRDLCPASTATG